MSSINTSSSNDNDADGTLEEEDAEIALWSQKCHKKLKFK